MAYQAPSVAELANFSGRSEASYLPYASTSLLQAALLFTLVTGISDPPDDADQVQLIKNAIMDMAADIYLKQPFRAVLAKPMSSETIGSYSYTINSAAFKAMTGNVTGLMWWDLALSILGRAETAIGSGSIAVFDRDHNIWTDSDGHLVLVGPAEVSNRGLSYNDLNQGYPGDVISFGNSWSES